MLIQFTPGVGRSGLFPILFLAPRVGPIFFQRQESPPSITDGLTGIPAKTNPILSLLPCLKKSSILLDINFKSIIIYSRRRSPVVQAVQATLPQPVLASPRRHVTSHTAGVQRTPPQAYHPSPKRDSASNQAPPDCRIPSPNSIFYRIMIHYS